MLIQYLRYTISKQSQSVAFTKVEGGKNISETNICNTLSGLEKVIPFPEIAFTNQKFPAENGPGKIFPPSS